MIFSENYKWEANLICENLYLGAIDSAFDKEGLLEHKITHIVHIENYFKPKFLSEFTYLVCDLEDSGGKEMLFIIEHALPFIRKGRKKGNVLVHCAAGISRSSSVVLAFLLTEFGDVHTNVDQCKQFIQTKRSIACPQSGFMACLKEFKKYNLDFNSPEIKEYLKNSKTPPIQIHKKKKKKRLILNSSQKL